MRIPGTIVVLACVSLGCGPDGDRPPAAPAPAEARAALVAALDAWKAGDVARLARATPPIRFVDPDRDAGARLDAYMIGDGGTAVGPTRELPVELVLRDRRGKARTAAAVYQVATAPDLAVLRNDP